MAKRMFNQEITESDTFLCNLSHSAQALYFLIGMNCDNEGFCGRVQMLARLDNIDPQCIQELIDNDLIIALNNNVYVITDWYRNNNIDKSHWKNHPSEYVQQRRQLMVDENKHYCLAPDGKGLTQPYFMLTTQKPHKPQEYNKSTVRRVIAYCFQIKQQPYTSIEQAQQDDDIVSAAASLLNKKPIEDIIEAAKWANKNRSPRTLIDLFKSIPAYWSHPS